MSNVIRAFVAMPISEAVRGGLERAQAQLRKADAHVSWVKPEYVHLTLAFLGDIFESQVPGLAGLLDSSTRNFEPFTLNVQTLGFFGSERSLRVIWAGVDASSTPLSAIQAQLAGGIRSLGFALEERSFHPHLTLGRVRSRKGVDSLTSLLRSAKNTGFGLVKVDRVLLMQSHMAHQGVRYSVLHEGFLKGVRDYGSESTVSRGGQEG